MQISAIYRLMGGDGDPTGVTFYGWATQGMRQAEVRRGQKQYDYRMHDVANKVKRPDKDIFVPTGEKDPVTGEDLLRHDTAPVVRAPMSIQQYIIKQKASFTRGSGVKLRPSSNTEVFTRVYNNWYKNKTDFFLGEIARLQMADTQVALIFFSEVDAAGEQLSLEDFRLRFLLAAPSLGDEIAMFFDPDTGKPTAFVRKWVRAAERPDENGIWQETVTDIYVAPDPSQPGSRVVRRRYLNSAPGGMDYTDETLPYTKLNVIYWEQDRPECDGTAELIHEFETGFSDFLTQQGYTADPILFGKGTTLNLPAKGSAGKFIEGSEDAELKYVTPADATSSRELQFKLLQKYIFSLNRSVLLDLDTMQSLSEVSGAALDRYLIDAYMDATDRQMGPWGMGVQRMVNFMLHVWKDVLEVPQDDTTIDVEFTKYRVEDIRETVEVMLLANGNKPLIDHEASVAAAGLADDPAIAFERLQDEAREAQERQEAISAGQQGSTAQQSVGRINNTPDTNET